MKITVNIYHSRYTGVTVTSCNMPAEDYALICSREIDIDTPEEYDWVAHDAARKECMIAELRAQLDELECSV